MYNMKIPKNGHSGIASKDVSFFRRGIHLLPERWEKVASDEQYFE